MSESESPRRHRRKSIRLRDYHYSSEGAYFVTICTLDRAQLLGAVSEDGVSLSHLGRIVEARWNWLPTNFPMIRLDRFIVMPNHIHGILWFGVQRQEGGSSPAPTTLMQVTGAFKTLSTRDAKQLTGIPSGSIWQRSFYEHVIRNEDELNRVRHYILENPLRWALEQEEVGSPDFSVR